MGVLAPGLVGYWPFESESGGVTPDVSGNGNNGTVDGATAGTGLRGKGYGLDGGDDRIIMNGLIAGLANSTVGTIEMWVNLDNDDGNDNIFFSISRDANAVKSEIFFNFDMKASANNFTAAMQIDGTPQWTLRTPIGSVNTHVGNWVHIAIVQDATKPKLYINAINQNLDNNPLLTDTTKWLKAIITDASNKADTVNVGLLARNSGIIAPFEGSIDEVMAWDKIRTEAGIRMDMQGYVQGGM